jgi:uncharacterized protein (UPF0261 family)
MKKIAIVGTLDTKFEEMGFIRDFVQKNGHDPVIIDAGIMGSVPLRLTFHGTGWPRLPE